MRGKTQHYRYYDRPGFYLVWGIRGGEWWIGARRTFLMDGIEFGLFGLTLIVGRRKEKRLIN